MCLNKIATEYIERLEPAHAHLDDDRYDIVRARVTPILHTDDGIPIHWEVRDILCKKRFQFHSADRDILCIVKRDSVLDIFKLWNATIVESASTV